MAVASAISLLFILVIPMTFGQFTAQTLNVDNQFVAGTLGMTNSRDGEWIVSATNMKPGDVADGTVEITNSGTVPFTLALSQTDVTNDGPAGSDDLAAQLDLLIEDANDVVIYDGKFDSLSDTVIAGFGDNDQWDPAESREFTFIVTFPSDSGDTYQGTSANATFVWDATQ
jgi:spore coat-associated protein N